MAELTVRILGEDDWATYRAVRLAALQESPAVFGDTHDQESAADETHWRSQLSNAERLVAEQDGAVLGVVTVGTFSEEPESAELSGLWVAPEARSSGVAWRLVEAAANRALVDGMGQMYYWTGIDNGRAIGFASSFGFRVTSHRRPASVGDEMGESEIAFVLPLGQDPNAVPNAGGIMLHM